MEQTIIFPKKDHGTRYRGLTFSSTPAGTTMDLNEREWGQMGVMSIHGTLGWTMLAPAAREYAVLPVGVAMMIPRVEDNIIVELRA